VKRLFVRRGNYAVARLDQLVIQVWRDSPRKSGPAPIRFVMNHPDLADLDNPSHSGYQESVKFGTHSWDNWSRILNALGLPDSFEQAA
jgi:hypothetical protein